MISSETLHLQIYRTAAKLLSSADMGNSIGKLFLSAPGGRVQDQSFVERARRLIACWNAFKGMETEKIEAIARQVADGAGALEFRPAQRPHLSAHERIAAMRPAVRGTATEDAPDGREYSCWFDKNYPSTPFFALEVAQQVAKEFSDQDFGVRYDQDSDAFWEYSDDGSGKIVECEHPCPAYTAPDGTRVHGIGYWHNWCWNSEIGD